MQGCLHPGNCLRLVGLLVFLLLLWSLLLLVLDLEELEALDLEELEALGLEELEALVLEELEAPWSCCLEELEALVGRRLLEDLEDVGKVVQAVAPSEFVLPGNPPPPPRVFPP